MALLKHSVESIAVTWLAEARGQRSGAADGGRRNESAATVAVRSARA
jgi:hypothetical protein